MKLELMWKRDSDRSGGDYNNAEYSWFDLFNGSKCKWVSEIFNNKIDKISTNKRLWKYYE